jgi:hypothetical protein
MARSCQNGGRAAWHRTTAAGSRLARRCAGEIGEGGRGHRALLGVPGGRPRWGRSRTFRPLERFGVTSDPTPSPDRSLSGRQYGPDGIRRTGSGSRHRTRSGRPRRPRRSWSARSSRPSPGRRSSLTDTKRTRSPPGSTVAVRASLSGKSVTRPPPELQPNPTAASTTVPAGRADLSSAEPARDPRSRDPPTVPGSTREPCWDDRSAWRCWHRHRRAALMGDRPRSCTRRRERSERTQHGDVQVARLVR